MCLTFMWKDYQKYRKYEKTVKTEGLIFFLNRLTFNRPNESLLGLALKDLLVCDAYIPS